MSNKVTETALEILKSEADLPLRINYNKGRPTVDDFEMYTFEQTWSSTALGFGGIGGQAMTTARTYVFIPVSVDEQCFVYFAGGFAYAVPYSEVLVKDIRKCRMEPRSKCGKYIKDMK